MIHRDLKPENVFLDSEVNVKLGDFGLATQSATAHDRGEPYHGPGRPPIESMTPAGMMTGDVGTTLYLAPELLGNDKVYFSKKVDLYSCGIIL